MTGRVAFVSGSSRGIGRACAERLAAEGARVAAAARDEARLEEVVKAIRGRGGEAEAYVFDLSSQASIQDCLGRIEKSLGPIEILVNNAAVTRDGLAMRMSRRDWDEVLQTNLSGSFFCIQGVLRGMLKKRWGRIINIASVVGQSGNPGQANYVASKAGLIGLTKSLALELASRSITVNAVAPGFIETDMTAALDPNTREKVLARIPLGRMGSPEDVAAAVSFLASGAAGYVTGHILNVNGGLYV